MDMVMTGPICGKSPACRVSRGVCGCCHPKRGTYYDMPEILLRDAVLGWMRSPHYQPMTRSEIARALKIPSTQRSELRQTLEALAKEGLIAEGRKSRYLLCATAPHRVTGVLKFHPKGHAWLYPDRQDPTQPTAAGIDLADNLRVIIARRDAGTALEGDRVAVSLRTPKDARGKRYPSDGPPEIQGRVEAVLERRSGRLVGVFQRAKKFCWVECEDRAVDGRVEITSDTTAEPGQLVVVDIASWTDPTTTPRGRVIEVLGWPGDAGVDIISVIHRFGLHTGFPEPVLAEARAVPENPEPAEMARRQDWREKLVITIDPADAKDHDDAIWVEATPDGWQLAVHIADVSHYIRPGSPMDKEAVQRGNSTYLVDRVLPMLPVELSNGICSLKPDVDRLTKCAILHISRDGRVMKARFVDAVIHSRAKLSYEQAQTIIDGGHPPAGATPGLRDMIHEAWRMASQLRARRFAHGSLDLEMPEVRIRLDSQGRACAAEHVQHTASHQLIEECMLVANEAVARVLKQRMRPAIYRIHEDPDPAKLTDYTETALLHGYRPGDLTNRAHVQKLLDDSKGRPDEHIIKIGLLKSLKRAAYSADPVGHYGLAKVDYCHFTSPIRRYADLIVHRALQPLLENPQPRPDRTLDQAELMTLARHISDTERTSAEAESETKMIKLFEYLARVVEMQDPHEFDGLVTEARPMGLMVEVPDLGIRGVLKYEDLLPGRWRFEGHRMAWVSEKGLAVQPGMKLPLHVVGLDRTKRFVDFAMAGPPSSSFQPLAIPRQKPQLPKRATSKAKPAAQAGPSKKPRPTAKKSRRAKRR
jgi:ribonuclease R